MVKTSMAETSFLNWCCDN